MYRVLLAEGLFLQMIDVTVSRFVKEKVCHGLGVYRFRIRFSYKRYSDSVNLIIVDVVF